jgi:glycosyltransferase involved in cell wall biosynthesis
MEKQKNILITAPNLDTNKNVSGISSVIKLTIEKGNNHYVHLVLGKEDGESALSLKWIYRLIIKFLSCYRILKNGNIDLVHLNIPCDPKGICREYFILMLAVWSKKPVLAHLHGGVFFTEKIKNPVYKYLFGQILKKSSKVFVLSELEKQYLQDNFNFNASIVLNNAIDVNAIPFHPEINEVPQILFLGRIDKNKGLKEITETFGNIDKSVRFKFVLCGDGPDRDWFVSECRNILHDHFTYKGVVSGKNKIDVISQSDVFILPSYFEGLPMSLLETMGGGVIPVTTSVGSISQVVTHSYNGIIVKPRDAGDLTEKLENLLSDKKMMIKLRKNARKSIFDRFDIVKYINELEHIYCSILSAG